MPKFVVGVRQVLCIEVLVEADTWQQARQLADQLALDEFEVRSEEVREEDVAYIQDLDPQGRVVGQRALETPVSCYGNEDGTYEPI